MSTFSAFFQVAHLGEPSLRCAPLNGGVGELGAQIRDMLGDEGSGAALEKAVPLAIGLDLPFRRFDLLPQNLDASGEPGAGPLGVVELVFQTCYQIELGQRVQDPGRRPRVLGGEIDDDGAGAWDLLGLNVFEHRIDDLVILLVEEFLNRQLSRVGFIRRLRRKKIQSERVLEKR